MNSSAVRWRLISALKAIVANHMRDAKPIVAEKPSPSRSLRAPVRLKIAPGRDRRLIAPE
jgi:hypothetical protein